MKKKASTLGLAIWLAILILALGFAPAKGSLIPDNPAWSGVSSDGNSE